MNNLNKEKEIYLVKNMKVKLGAVRLSGGRLKFVKTTHWIIKSMRRSMVTTHLNRMSMRMIKRIKIRMLTKLRRSMMKISMKP
jgi:hypothetical protein